MNNTREKYLDFFTLCLFVITCVYIAVDPIWHFGMYVNDFRGYYAAAYVFRHGGNPYDYYQTAKALLLITGYMGNNPFYYVPWLAWAFVPLTFFSFRISFLVWNVINLGLWFIGLRQIKLVLHLPWKGWRQYSLYFVATLSFAWVTFRYGQIGFVLMTLFLAAILAIQREQWVWSGVWMALCLIKPNVTIIPVGVICLWLLLNRVWKPAFVVVLVNVVLLISSLIVMPNWYQPLLMPHAFDGINYDTDGPSKLTRDRINPTILGVMKILKIDTGVAAIIYLTSVIVGFVILGIALHSIKSLLDMAFISTTLWLLLTPYVQTQDYVLLVTVFFFLVTVKINPIPVKIIGLCIVGIAPLLGTTPLNSYIMIVSLAVLLLLYYIQRRKILSGEFSQHLF